MKLIVVSDSFLILVNNLKDDCQNLKKVNFIFSFEPSPFYWTKLSKAKETWS